MMRRALIIISATTLLTILDTVQAQPISPASPAAREIWRLYNIVLILAILVGAVSFGFLAYFTIKYRERRPPAEPTGPVADRDLVIGHLVAAVAYFVVGGTFAAIASLQQAIGGNIVLTPEQLSISLADHSVIMLWGWGLLGVLGLCYFFLTALLNVRVFSRSAASASFWLINLGVIGSLLSFSDSPFTTPTQMGWPGAPISLLHTTSQLLVGVGFYVASFNVVATFLEGSRGKKYLDIPVMAVTLVVSAMMFLGGSALYSGLMIVLLLKQFLMPKAVIDPLFIHNLLSFIFKPMFYMLLFPIVGALCHYLPEKAGRPLQGKNGIYRVAVPLLVILAFTQWMADLKPMLPWSKTLGELTGWAMLVPVGIVLAGSYSTFRGGSSGIWDTKTRLLTGAAIAWVYAAILGVLVGSPLSPFMLNAQVTSAYRHLLLLGVYSLGLLAIIADLWIRMNGRELLGQAFGKIHFWSTSIGVFGISTAMLIAGLGGMKGRALETSVLIAVFALAIGLPQYGYSLQIFRSFMDVGIRKIWGVLGLAVGFAVANAAIYGLAANKFGLSLFTGIAVTIGGATILFFSIAILLSERPKPSAASIPP